MPWRKSPERMRVSFPRGKLRVRACWNFESLKTSAPHPAPPRGRGCCKPKPHPIPVPIPVPTPCGAGARGTHARAGAGSAPCGGQRSAPCAQEQRRGQRPSAPAGPASASASTSGQATMAGPARPPLVPRRLSLASARPQPAAPAPRPRLLRPPPPAPGRGCCWGFPGSLLPPLLGLRKLEDAKPLQVAGRRFPWVFRSSGPRSPT